MEASDLHETLLDCGILGIRLQHLQDDLQFAILLLFITVRLMVFFSNFFRLISRGRSFILSSLCLFSGNVLLLSRGLSE